MCLAEQSPRDAALAQLAGLDPAMLDTAALMGQITDLATFISQAQGHLARLAGVLDATGGAADAGYTSASAFLRTRCGLSPGHAAAVTTTARGLRGLQATQEALAAGVISFDQAQVITRTTAGLDDTDAATLAERVLLDHAPGLDTARFRQFAAEVAYRADPGAADEREKRRWERRDLSFGLTLDSTGMLSGTCGDAVSYEIVRTAAEAFGPPGGQADARTAAQRRMDGLVAACKAALDGGQAPERHGAAPHITILVKDETLAQAALQDAARAAAAAQDAARTAAAAWSHVSGRAPSQPRDEDPSIGALQDGFSGPAPATAGAAAPGTAPGQAVGVRPGQAAGGSPSRAGGTAPGQAAGTLAGQTAGALPGQTSHGTALTARQVLALCCGAQVGAIRWRDGLPLGVGRTMRTEPPGLRRALEARDRGCRWPGCGALAAWATAHHIRPWSQGGATSLDGLALFCHVHHHHFIHLQGWTITGDPNSTLYFTNPGGWLTLDSPLPGTDQLAA
jgi:hypothetical protein